MKKTPIYLILITIITFMVFSTAFAQTDSVPNEPAKKTAIGIRFGGMASDLWFPGTDPEEDKYYDCPIRQTKAMTSYLWGISYYRNVTMNMIFTTDIMYQKKDAQLTCVHGLLWPPFRLLHLT